MDYKSKIKNFKPEYDALGWDSMEKLLEDSPLLPKRLGLKDTVIIFLKKWSVSFLSLGIIAIAISFFIMNESPDVPVFVNDKENQTIPTNQDIESNTIKNKELQDQSDDQSISKSVISYENIEHKGAGKKTSIEEQKTDVSSGLSLESNVVANLTSNNLQPENHLNNEAQNDVSFNKGLPAFEQHDNDKLNGSNTSKGTYSSNLNRQLIIDDNTNLNQGIEGFEEELKELVKMSDLTSLPTLSNLLIAPEYNLIESINVITKPTKTKHKFSIGIEAGKANSDHYVDNLYGRTYSLMGTYKLNKWFTFGLKYNTTSVKESGDYIVNADIKTSRLQSSFGAFAQVIPLRIWRFELGVEGGIGLLQYNEKVRTFENSTPNNLMYNHTTRSSSSTIQFYGALINFNLTNRAKIGMHFGQTNSGMNTTSIRAFYKL